MTPTRIGRRVPSPNPGWWENAIVGTCSHGGHDWEGDTCDEAERGPIMADYKPDGFTMTEARLLSGAIADITAWHDDDRTILVTYRAATVLGTVGRDNYSWLTIATAGAEMTDAETGEVLGDRPAEPELNVPFTGICRVEEAS